MEIEEEMSGFTFNEPLQPPLTELPLKKAT